MRCDDGKGMKAQVILHHTTACWMAEFRGAVGDEMKAMAGADIVPTGFNGHVPGPVVRQAIALLNPDSTVTIAGDASAEAPALIVEKTAALPTGRPSPGAIKDLVAKERRPSPHVERALQIRKSLGIVVASRYLKRRGWTFEAAHRVLLQTWPRKLEACMPDPEEIPPPAPRRPRRERRLQSTAGR